jgi:hypothetical protein
MFCYSGKNLAVYKQIEFDIFLNGKYIYCYGNIFCPLSKYFAQEAKYIKFGTFYLAFVANLI